MTISLTCTCGKALKAQQVLAGKRGKCPRCGSIFVIPQSSISASHCCTDASFFAEAAATVSSRVASPRTNSDGDAAMPLVDKPRSAFQRRRRLFNLIVGGATGVLLVLVAVWLAMSRPGISIAKCNVLNVSVVDEKWRGKEATTVGVVLNRASNKIDILQLKLVARDGTSYSPLVPVSSDAGQVAQINCQGSTWILFSVDPNYAKSTGWMITYSGKTIADFDETLPVTDLTASNPNEAGRRNSLPYQIDDKGWSLSEDCVLDLDREPYIADTDQGRFIFAESVTIIPSSNHSLRFVLHPTENGPKVSVRNLLGSNTARPIIQLNANVIPLKPSMGLKTADRFIIAGGEDGNVFGGEVRTDTVKSGVTIMSPQEPKVVMMYAARK